MKQNTDPYRSITQPQLIELFKHWDVKRGWRRMPAFDDLRFGEIEDLIPFIYLIDVLHDPVRFHSRFMGSAVRDYIGRDFAALVDVPGQQLGDTPWDVHAAPMGGALDESLYGDKTADVLELLFLVVDVQTPVGAWGPETIRDIAWAEKEAILLPLSDKQGRISMLLGANVGTRLYRDDEVRDPNQQKIVQVRPKYGSIEEGVA